MSMLEGVHSIDNNLLYYQNLVFQEDAYKIS